MSCLVSTVGGASESAPVTDPVTESDINFFDYDGTLVASWALAELASKSSLPDGPTHEGLTFQAWNWTLANLQSANIKMNVGANYVTDDGKTRIYVTMPYGQLTMQMYFGVSSTSYPATIDWGDGNTTIVSSTSTTTARTHTYSSYGDYVITIAQDTGGTITMNGGSSYPFVGGSASTYRKLCTGVQVGSNITSIGNYAFYYCYSLQSITIPSGVTSIGNYAFYYCYSLQSITIPSGVTSILINTFAYCYSLQSITIPSGVTSIGNYTFAPCYSLQSITIPSGVTSIGDNAFYNCGSLQFITIPSGVTSIGNSAFNACVSLHSLKLTSTSVPTAGGDSILDNTIPLTILVPSASLSAYQAATYWSEYAAYMVGY